MILKILLLSLATFIFSSPCFAQQSWIFQRTYETKALISTPFFLNTTADINKNGTKEVIFADFGQFGDHIEEWKQWKKIPERFYNLFVVEWEGQELKVKLHKQWDMNLPKTRDERDEYFMAYKAKQMVAWKSGDRVMVETVPPYLGIEWQAGTYNLREQMGWAQKKPLVGSWTFPWLSSSCYANFPDKPSWPRECMIGMRDFDGKGEPKIVTVLEDKIGDNQYKQTIRVRKYGAGYPIVWEAPSPKRFNWWMKWSIVDPTDRLKLTAKGPLLMTAFQESPWYLIEPDKKGRGYLVQKSALQGMMGLKPFDLPDIYLGSSQNKDIEEYWGYRRIELPGQGSVSYTVMLRKVTIKKGNSEFIVEDIDFSHHDNFLGVGYFIVEDLDNDGLDEIILVEETAGKVSFGE